MDTTDSIEMSASEAAQLAANHPVGGKYRRDSEPVTAAAAAAAGRHVDLGSTNGLLLDACAGAELIAQHAESWSPEQILVHPEIAKLAMAEATRGREPRPSRLRRRRNSAEDAGELRLAADLLDQAHARISFLES